jgi:hypothetical protein
MAPMKRKSSRSRMQLEVVLTGDQRLAENVILEVRALAKRYGLGVPSVKVMRRPAVGPKAQTSAPRGDASSRARRASLP